MSLEQNNLSLRSKSWKRFFEPKGVGVAKMRMDGGCIKAAILELEEMPLNILRLYNCARRYLQVILEAPTRANLHRKSSPR
jgi:hypothetical protein